ncbi:MAG: transglutaminase domain-containing protein, partial [Candidatus Udaeobacter sp.]
QSQQLPQITKGASQAATMQASMSDVAEGLKKFITGYAAKSPDNKFHMPYQRKDLALDLVKLHDDRFSNLGSDKYFACVDMKGADGKFYDIDFLMMVKPGKLTVTETSVHKVNGKPLYNWKQDGGVWKKVKVS